MMIIITMMIRCRCAWRRWKWKKEKKKKDKRESVECSLRSGDVASHDDRVRSPPRLPIMSSPFAVPSLKLQTAIRLAAMDRRKFPTTNWAMTLVQFTSDVMDEGGFTATPLPYQRRVPARAAQVFARVTREHFNDRTMRVTRTSRGTIARERKIREILPSRVRPRKI